MFARNTIFSKIPGRAKGFSLIEIIVVIVILGVLATVAVRSISQKAYDAKFDATVAEMDAIAKAVVGDPDLVANGVRTDFGYVGDCGAWPTSLNGLVTNPGVGNWNGPYLSDNFSEVQNDYLYDAWGNAYTFPNNYTVRSSGGGQGNITKQIVNSTTDALSNSIFGNLYDWNGSSPAEADLTNFTVSVNLQSGGTVAGTINSGGIFQVNGVHIGNHTLVANYTGVANTPTVTRYITVNPASSSRIDIRFQTTFAGTGPGGGGGGGGSGGSSTQAELLTVTGSNLINSNKRADLIRLTNTSTSQSIEIDLMTISWTNASGETVKYIGINGMKVWPELLGSPQVSGGTEDINNGILPASATDYPLVIEWGKYLFQGSNANPQGESLTIVFIMADGSTKTYP